MSFSVLDRNRTLAPASSAMSAVTSEDSLQFIRQGIAAIMEQPKIISRYSTQFLAAMQTHSPLPMPSLRRAEAQRQALL